MQGKEVDHLRSQLATSEQTVRHLRAAAAAAAAEGEPPPPPTPDMAAPRVAGRGPVVSTPSH